MTKKIKIYNPNYNVSKERKEEIKERSKKYKSYIEKTQWISNKSLYRKLSN